MNGSPSRYFVLSGLVLHELRWQQTLDSVVAFRTDLRNRYGFKLREEIHAAHMIHKPGDLSRIAKSIRLKILKETLRFVGSLPDINVINIVVDKTGKDLDYDVFEMAWTVLIQRFHNTISHRNFPGPQNPEDLGLMIVDRTDEKKLRNLTRRMRRYNPIPDSGGGGNYRQILVSTLVEDPIHRDSLHSYFVQLADVNAYFLHQKIDPCKYIKKKGGRNYFDQLGPILCTVASRNDKQGIVWI